VLSHATALLRSGPEGACQYIQADIRDPRRVLGEAASTLDLGQPAAAAWPASRNPDGWHCMIMQWCAYNCRHV
jgi:hypothetical protein